MSNQQNNKTPYLHPDERNPSIESSQHSHFAHARKTIESWPEWKRNIRCMPTSMDSNQSIRTSDKE